MAPTRILALSHHDLHHESVRLAQREHMSMTRFENLTAAVDNVPRIFGHLQERTDLLQAIEVLGSIRRRRLWRACSFFPGHRAPLDDLHTSHWTICITPGRTHRNLGNLQSTPTPPPPRRCACRVISPHEALRANLSPFARYIEQRTRTTTQRASNRLYFAPYSHRNPAAHADSAKLTPLDLLSKRPRQTPPCPAPSRHAPQPKGAPA